MNFRDNIISFLMIACIFTAYHLLQPMGDGFVGLSSQGYTLKKHGLDDNKHAKFKDKGEGRFDIRAGVEDDVRGEINIKRDGVLRLQFRIVGQKKEALVIKHNDVVLPSIHVAKDSPQTRTLNVHSDDDIELIAESDDIAKHGKIKAQLSLQSDWFSIQNQLASFLWAILFIFLWGKKHVFIALNTYFIFMLMLAAQKMNFGALTFHDILIYLLLSFALAFGSVLVHQELAWFRKYKVAAVINLILALFIYIVPISFIIYTLNFNAKVGIDDLNAVFQTNGTESLEYIFDFVGLEYILLFVGLATVIGFLLHQQELKETHRIEVSLLFFLTFTFLSISLAQLPELALPKFISQSFAAYNHELKLFRHVQDKRKTGEVTFSATKTKQGETYVVVIGESLNKKNMGLYGYVRPTTPKLSARMKAGDLLAFQQVYANYSYTIKALQLALTEANQYNNKDYYDSLSIVDVLKQAGFETHWLTNQVIYGGWDNMISVIANEADHLVALNHTIGKHTRTQHYDGVLIDEVQKVLAEKTDKNRVIFVHLMGNHGSYSSRYPEDFHKFDGDLPRDVFGDLASLSHGKQKINHYDNSIVYNDDVVDGLISALSKEQGVTALLYMPDHADDALAGKGHHSSKFNFHMLQIPMLAWFSEAYKQTYASTVQALQTHKNTLFTNDMFYDTLLGLMAVQSDRYEALYDFTSLDYTLDAEHALVLHGKKHVTDKKNMLWWQKENANFLKREGLLSRILPHKINSLGKLDDIWRDGYRSWEMDVVFDEAQQGFFAGSSETKKGAKFETFFKRVPHQSVQKVWIEFNKFDVHHALPAVQYLEALDKQYQLKQRLMIESDTESDAFKILAEHGWQTMYYLSTKNIKHLMQDGDVQALKTMAKHIAAQLRRQKVSGISFDAKVYDFVKVYLEPKLTKKIAYHAWYGPALKAKDFQQSLQNNVLYKDKRVNVLLSKYASQY